MEVKIDPYDEQCVNVTTTTSQVNQKKMSLASIETMITYHSDNLASWQAALEAAKATPAIAAKIQREASGYSGYSS